MWARHAQKEFPHVVGVAAGELCSKLEGRVQRALPELARALMGGSFNWPALPCWYFDHAVTNLA